MKYGSTDKWFGFAFACLTVSISGFVASSTTALVEWAPALRTGAITLAALGGLLAVLGVAVYAYNRRNARIATVVIAGTSSPEDERRAALSEKRDELEVEKARLKPLLYGSLSATRLSALSTPAGLKAQGEHEAARVKSDQIDGKIRAINAELRELTERSLASLKPERRS